MGETATFLCMSNNGQLKMDYTYTQSYFLKTALDFNAMSKAVISKPFHETTHEKSEVEPRALCTGPR